MEYNITPLFSTPLYTCNTGRSLTQDEEKFISSLPEKKLEMGNYGSVSTNFLDFPELSEFKTFCMFHLKKLLLVVKSSHQRHFNLFNK